jgi:hypothetical protein
MGNSKMGREGYKENVRDSFTIQTKNSGRRKACGEKYEVEKSGKNWYY